MLLAEIFLDLFGRKHTNSVIRVKNAVEMVTLVADCAGKKLGARYRVAVTVSVGCFYRYSHRSVSYAPFVGEREAALKLLLSFLRAIGDYGIYHLVQLALLDLDEDYSSENSDLYGGKTASVRPVKCVLHIVKQTENTRRDLCHLTALLAEYRIVVLNYLQYCHFSFCLSVVFR